MPVPSTQNSGVFRFGPFEADLRTRELRKNGLKLKLQDQPFRVLAMLLERPGDLVTREEIRTRLWLQNTFVDFEHGLNAAVRRLREALSDNADLPRFVETLPRRGYRFIAPVEKEGMTGEAALPMRREASGNGPETERAVSPRGGAGIRPVAIWLTACALALLAGAFEWLRPSTSAPRVAPLRDWVQLTDFADSAVSPALSPDGRILAFIRGEQTFFGHGEIYAKVLPDGEPVRLTRDGTAKMSPEFSADGSRIAYTVITAAGWDTWSVPVLGGEAREMLPNAAGLTWIDGSHLLFSEIKSGLHMAVVTSTDSRDDSRDVYVPPRERGMAHRSAVSPDHKWVLVAEMDNDGWLPCRLVSFDGSFRDERVGPPGAGCTYVAWSPDQKWMYFSSSERGRFHIWRQRFPAGEPQQLTSGATEEEGIAVAPDGRSLITSVGLRESTIWVRDRNGERQASFEGFAEYPTFSPDGKQLFYLVRLRGVSGQWVRGQLWAVDLASGRRRRLLSGTRVSGYDISPDGTAVVYSVTDKGDRARLWLASLDFRFPPREFPSAVNEDEPLWDESKHIYFRAAEGKLNFLYRMNEDGGGRMKVSENPVLEVFSVDPKGRWATVFEALGRGPTAHVFAVPLGGGAPVLLCATFCVPTWSADDKTVAVLNLTLTKTYVLPVDPARGLPDAAPGDIPAAVEAGKVPGAKVIAGIVIPGPTAELSAMERQDVHRNLYRIPLQ